jgi:tetratricopeptide (TPR) repeat protein
VEAGGEQRVEAAAPPLIAVAVLLALLCMALWANTRTAEFVGADRPGIVENAALRWRALSLANVRDTLAQAHPVAQLTLGLNYRLGGLRVHGYHALNTALHFANALLVFALGRALFRTRAGRGALSDDDGAWAAFAGAALFAAHPLQVEAVTWVSQRGTLLAALFGLGAALCWLRGRAASRGARALWWAAAGTGWLLALGSHEAAASLPLAIALCEWLARGAPVREARPWLLLGLGLAVAAAWTAERHAVALALYESLVVWPSPDRLSLAHDIAASPIALGAAVALQALLLGVAVASARRYPVLAFALLWFFCAHAVSAAAAPAAEHRNYFALIGPALGAGYALFAALRQRIGLATALAVLSVTALGAATHARNEQWRSAAALWDDAVAKHPRDAAARLERGALREQRDDADGALADFEEAVRLAPDSAPARERLAAGLVRVGRESEALPHARAAIALDAGSAEAHAALGEILASLGELEPAAAEFERALELGADRVLERSLGDTLVRLGRYAEALPHYDAAIARDPGDDDARTSAGAALVELARARDALAYLEPAVESQPNPRYLAHFADALWQLGDAGGALDAASMAVRVAPSWPGAASRLAWMLALCPDHERRDPARALRIADAALAQAGGSDAQLLSARAAALAANGRWSDARAEADHAASVARAAGNAALAESIARHAQTYAHRKPWPDPPRPFDPSP